MLLSSGYGNIAAWRWTPCASVFGSRRQSEQLCYYALEGETCPAPRVPQGWTYPHLDGGQYDQDGETSGKARKGEKRGEGFQHWISELLVGDELECYPEHEDRWQQGAIESFSVDGSGNAPRWTATSSLHGKVEMVNTGAMICKMGYVSDSRSQPMTNCGHCQCGVKRGIGENIPTNTPDAIISAHAPSNQVENTGTAPSMLQRGWSQHQTTYLQLNASQRTGQKGKKEVKWQAHSDVCDKEEGSSLS